jgi:hypothetical protein
MFALLDPSGPPPDPLWTPSCSPPGKICRAGFVECVIRTGILKFLRSTTSRYAKPHLALDGLLTNHMLPHLRREASLFMVTANPKP